MWTTRLVVVMLVMTGVAHAGKKKKNKEPPPPIEGWHQEEGWVGACFYPQDFASLGSGTKRMAWQATRDALMGQWQGQRGDGVNMDPKAVLNVETALLAKPERIEAVAATNLEHCQTAMKDGSTIAWSSWFTSLYGELTAGECPWPNFSVTMYNYLDINNDWQNPANVCKGDKVRVKCASIDYFRLEPKGEWFNCAGDGQEASTGLPCTEPGCQRGQLIVRFKGESGITFVQPIGLEGTITAPEHGSISVMINDDSLSDNFWKIERGLEHHAAIDYMPGD